MKFLRALIVAIDLMLSDLDLALSCPMKQSDQPNRLLASQYDTFKPVPYCLHTYVSSSIFSTFI